MKWSVVKLGDICDVKGGKRLPNGADFSDFGYPYIRARDIRGGKVTFQEPVYIDQSIRDKIKNYTVNKNEICITIVGVNVGDVGIVPAFLDGANLTENAAKLINFKGCDENYLNHYLQSSGIKEQMQLFSSGSAQDKLGLYKIKLLDVIPSAIENSVFIF
jgi:type I restriction enzyme S subunit